MSLSMIRESEDMKAKKQKASSLQHASSSRYQTADSLLADQSKQGDNATQGPEQRSKPDHTLATGHMGDSKLPTWHYAMEQTFESFLTTLDDISISLKRDNPKDEDGGSADVSGYKEICQKLRTEILIALDRLELLTIPEHNISHEKSLFLEKLNEFKSKLSDLRWEYHNAIRDLETRIV